MTSARLIPCSLLGLVLLISGCGGAEQTPGASIPAVADISSPATALPAPVSTIGADERELEGIEADLDAIDEAIDGLDATAAP